MALFADVIKYEGDNTTFVWKYPKEDFNTSSQLIVHENQEAIFFKNGQALDVFLAGRYTLDTSNIPILSSFINIPTGGKTPFHCEVYFINKTHQMGIKWGTDSQVQYMDPKYNFPLQIGASGEMILSVNNSKKLLVRCVGTEKSFTQTDLIQKFRAILMSKIKPYIANTMQTSDFSIFEVDSHMGEVSDALKELLTPDFNDYGLKLEKFLITNIAKPVDEPAYQKYKDLHIRQYADIAEARLRQQTELITAETEAKKVVIESQAMATKRSQEGYTYSQEQGFEVAKKVADNDAVAELTNLGVGLGTMAGVGGTVGGMVGGMMNHAVESAQEPSHSGDSMEVFKQKLEKLMLMKNMGVISDEEFELEKSKLLKSL